MFLNIIEEAYFVNDCLNLFTYNKETGKLYYKTQTSGFASNLTLKRWNSKFAGKEVKGAITKKGYIHIYVRGKRKYIQRIIFAIVENRLPNDFIDHIDNDKFNNKWSNLRECTNMENISNVPKRSTNKSGLKGVSWSKHSNCWLAQISHNNKKYKSLHKTKEEAYEAYCQMSEKLHKEFGNVR